MVKDAGMGEGEGDPVQEGGGEAVGVEGLVTVIIEVKGEEGEGAAERDEPEVAGAVVGNGLHMIQFF